MQDNQWESWGTLAAYASIWSGTKGRHLKVWTCSSSDTNGVNRFVSLPSFQACRSSVCSNQYQLIRTIESDLEPTALKERLAPQVNSAQSMGCRVLSNESSIEYSPWLHRSATDSGSVREIPGEDRRDRGAHQGEESREDAQEPLRQRCDPIRAFVPFIRFRVDRQGCPKQHLNLTTSTLQQH